MATLSLLLLGRINNNAIKIRALVIEAVVQTSNSDGVLALLEGKEKRSGQEDSLVGILLIERVDLVGLAVDDNAADAADLPGAVDAIGCAHGLVTEAHVVNV